MSSGLTCLLPGLLICVASLPIAAADEPASAETDAATSIKQPSADSSAPKSEATATIPLLKRIPWTQEEIAQLFEKAADHGCCEMYGADAEIFPETNELSPTAGSDTKRLPAFSVALTMSPQVQDSLPRLSRKRIISYLENHVLVLQSTVCRASDGGLEFGTKLEAGLCLTSKPSRSLKAEPMIAAAVSDFRTLGYYQSGEATGHRGQRTLVLAFRYVVAESEDDSESAKATEEFELIFLHVPSRQTVESGNMVVFATSDGRTNFHALAHSDPHMLTHSPTIVASVRFDHFKYFGLYPTKPVVTGLNLRSRLSVPTAEVRARLNAESGKATPTLWQLLNELHAKAVAPARLSQSN